MATITNNRSTLATDPIRNFRFLVSFQPHKVASSGVFSGPNGGTTPTTPAGELASIKFGFTSVGGFGVTTDAIPYREGGYNTTVHQIPGQTSFAPITLSRGVMLGTSQNWNWMKMLFQTVQGSANHAVTDDFRCDLEVQVLAHPIAYTASSSGTAPSQNDVVVQRFKVYNAWITSVAYSDLNAGDNAIMVEQIQLVHEGFEMTLGSGSDLTKSAAAIS